MTGAGDDPAIVHDESAAAFAALRAIQEGKWDRFLLRLRGAVRTRMESEDYREYLKNIRAGGGRRKQ